MHLGILTSHPIQYQAPLFRALAREVDLDVFFAHRQSAAEQGKAGFGVEFDWDVDLLSGYNHRFLNNVSLNPGVDSYVGCDTPEIAKIVSNQDAKQKVYNKDSNFRFAPFDAFIVMGWYLKSYMQAVHACRSAGVPVLVRGDSQLCTPRSAWKRFAMEFRQRWLLRKFDGFLSVGKRHTQYLRYYGVQTHKIFIAPHFVDNEWFRGKAMVGSRKFEIRKSWGVKENDMVALFVGKFIAKKRPMDLLQALANLKSSQPNYNYVAVFVGSGELEEEMHAMATRHKVGAYFAGFKNQSELSACYAAADVLVLPSDGGETWGLVVNEAMACGLPAIVSDAVGCAPDLIDDGKTGFTFPVKNVTRLSERLITMATLKRGGYNFVPELTKKLANYSIQVTMKGTISAAKSLSSES